MTELIGTIIVAVLSLLGVIVTNHANAKAIDTKLEVWKTRTDDKLDTLTKSVEKHNGFAERIPRLEVRIETLEKRFDEIKKGG